MSPWMEWFCPQPWCLRDPYQSDFAPLPPRTFSIKEHAVMQGSEWLVNEGISSETGRDNGRSGCSIIKTSGKSLTLMYNWALWNKTNFRCSAAGCIWLLLQLVILFVTENIMSLISRGLGPRLISSHVDADSLSSSFIMLPVLKTAFQLCVVAALASGLTRSSCAPHTLSAPLPLGALTLAFLASVLNLTLMQSERPLALLRHPYSAPSASGLPIYCSRIPFAQLRALSFTTTPTIPSALPSSLPQLHRRCWDAGLCAAAAVVWRVVPSEIQGIIVLSVNIMMETSRPWDITLGSLFILRCSVNNMEAHSAHCGSRQNPIGACFLVSPETLVREMNGCCYTTPVKAYLLVFSSLTSPATEPRFICWYIFVHILTQINVMLQHALEFLQQLTFRDNLWQVIGLSISHSQDWFWQSDFCFHASCLISYSWMRL